MLQPSRTAFALLVTYLSPLRYPGGKGLLLRFVRDLVRRNPRSHITYVEPFAGGAAIALGLLRSREVDHAIIGDTDPAISAFWKAALEHPDEFADLVGKCRVTIDTWHEQAHALSHTDITDTVTLGFAAFFLNRTNRSGILRARPIGGLNQTGPYKLDCRFNKTDLLVRLRRVAQLADRITVHNNDAIDLLDLLTARYAMDAFVYADPPYLTKSTDLYINTMTYEKHQQLADTLVTQFRQWIVSYDCDPRVSDELYPRHKILQFALRHSASRAHRGSEFMAFSPHVNPDSAAHLLRSASWVRRHHAGATALSS